MPDDWSESIPNEAIEAIKEGIETEGEEAPAGGGRRSPLSSWLPPWSPLSSRRPQQPTPEQLPLMRPAHQSWVDWTLSPLGMTNNQQD